MIQFKVTSQYKKHILSCLSNFDMFLNPNKNGYVLYFSYSASVNSTTVLLICPILFSWQKVVNNLHLNEFLIGHNIKHDIMRYI